ncbi:MAG: hypothetical protein ABW131_13735, partial [Candidatus Sedimenticola sp. 6PFRAG5]
VRPYPLVHGGEDRKGEYQKQEEYGFFHTIEHSSADSRSQAAVDRLGGFADRRAGSSGMLEVLDMLLLQGCRFFNAIFSTYILYITKGSVPVKC